MDGRFEEVPISVRDFLSSPMHMAFPSISERQLRLLEYMFGRTAENVFDNGRHLAVCCWGKGSGKDTCIIFAFCYLVYYLLCLKNPQQFLRLPSEIEPIDMLNMAPTKELATQVFFEKLRNTVKNWSWLKQRYTITSSAELDDSDKVVILKTLIQFPKHITLYSGNSEAGSYEGKNLIAFVLDEASGLATVRTDKANDIYRMLRTSAVSRFGTRYKGFIISYPRHKDDFTVKMFMDNLDNLNVYTDKGPTWEVKPASLFSGKFFRFKDYMIPTEFKEQFDADPFGSMTNLLCMPAEVEMPFIEMPDRIDRVAIQMPMALCETYNEGQYVKKKLLEWRASCDFPHIIGIDLGKKIDSAALSVVHVERFENSYRFVQDLLLTWTPNIQQEQIVSFTNVGRIVLELAAKIKVTAVVFDQWNSAQLIEELNSKGIPSYDVALVAQDYYFLKELIYSGKINLTCDAAQSNELKKLIQLTGGKIDHLPQYSKDRVDSVCSAVKMLRDTIRPDMGWGGMEEDFVVAERSGFSKIAPGSRF